MNAATRLAYRHLRSFRREDGMPYDLYVWVYSRAYRTAMRAIHRAGFHWFRARPGGRHCDWCGAHEPSGMAAQVGWGRDYIHRRYAGADEPPDWYEKGGPLP